jgi:hypothetical protein
MRIIINFLDEFQEDYELVMDFWNDNIIFSQKKNEIFGFKKYVKIMSK